MPAVLAREKRLLAARLLVFGACTISLIGVISFLRLEINPTGSSSGASPAQPTVTIAISRTPLSAPIIIAQKLGYFKDFGVQVELIEYMGGDRTFEAMIKGEAEFATSSDSVVMFQSFEHRDFSLLATFVRSDNDIKIISRRASNINSARDLVGKTAAVVTGSASEYFFKTYLTIEGIDPASVATVGIATEKLPAALSANEVDSIAIWEPGAYLTMHNGQPDVTLLDTKGLYNLTFNLLGASAFVESNQALAANLLRAIRQAHRFIYSEPEKSRAIIQAHLDLDENFVNWIWPDYLFGLTLNESLLLTLEDQASWAIDNGFLDRKKSPDFRLVIDSRPFNAIKRDITD